MEVALSAQQYCFNKGVRATMLIRHLILMVSLKKTSFVNYMLLIIL